MSLTPAQLAKIRQKEATLADSLKRDPLVGYYEGWFFVTLNTRDEVPVLSTCEGSPNIPEGQQGAPYCRYTEVGEGVIKAWQRMAEVCKTVELDLCEAMPEHFHGLLHLLPGNKRHLGSLISGFMSGCSHAYWDTLGIEWRKNRNEKVEAKMRGGKRAYAQLTPDRDPDHTYSYIGPALFKRGYNDVEPITAEQVEIKRAYIRDQARKRLIQGDRHVCFAKHMHQHSRNWTAERAMRAICADPYFARYSDKRESAMLNVLARLNRDLSPTISPNIATLPSTVQTPQPGIATLPSKNQAPQPNIVTLPSGKQLAMPGIGLDYIGNRALLASPRKLPLICHRADAWQFEKQKEAVLREARNGAVIVSAFISPKEREIKQQLMTEMLPLIEIMDNGFTERYKPVGKAFYACAENRLVQITCWNYHYQKDVQVSREMCMVMNELARVITATSDDWWKE